MLPGPLVSVAQSGKTQLRATVQVGWSWTEHYGPLKRSDTNAQLFLSQILSFWRNGTIFQIDHRAKRTLLGNGGGSPVINGSSQTGQVINTRGWTPGAANVLKAGDIVWLFGPNPGQLVYEVTNSPGADGSGNVVLNINPPLFPGNSPTDGTIVAINPGLTYRCRIASLQMPQAGPNEYYLGFSVSFQEVPA